MNESMIDVNSTADTTETDGLIQNIVTTVADAEGVDVTELPPLYDTIDPDALTKLTERNVTVEFTYYGRQVVVHGDRRVEITD